jgi:hypothetical protein
MQGHAHIKPILRPLDTLGDDRRHIAALMFPGRGSYYNDCFRNEVHDNFENDVHVGFTIYSTDRNYDNIVVKYNKLSPLQLSIYWKLEEIYSDGLNRG